MDDVQHKNGKGIDWSGRPHKGQRGERRAVIGIVIDVGIGMSSTASHSQFSLTGSCKRENGDFPAGALYGASKLLNLPKRQIVK